MSHRGAWAALLLIAAALALRLPKLETRPFHNDEAVNALKVTDLWAHGRYAYDPNEYHGPTLHYATVPFIWASGARNANDIQDSTLRLAPLACGIGLILLLILVSDALGRSATLWAALFTAISPAMVFYSRYFIHEMLLVFFTALALGAGWRYWRSRHPAWAAMTGAAVALMFATKETFLINVIASALALIATAAWARMRSPATEGACFRISLSSIRSPISLRHALIALAAFLVVWVLFFTSFFTNWQGLADSLRTYLPWLKRAGGHSPHIRPWWFYLERLIWFHPAKSPVWSEALIVVLALVGAIVAFVRRRTPLHVFLTFYTFALTCAYCLISYKTPWCMLGFLHGMILLAGIGAAALVGAVRSLPMKVATTVVLLGLAAQLTWQAVRASYNFEITRNGRQVKFAYASDRRNPYVFAQTVPDILRLVERVQGLGRVAPSGYDTVVKVICPESDYWPLPWYLRRFSNVGWYDQLPADPFAPVVVAAWKMNSRLDERSDRKWIMAGGFELRPGNFLELYVELELWKKFVATLPRDEEK